MAEQKFFLVPSHPRHCRSQSLIAAKVLTSKPCSRRLGLTKKIPVKVSRIRFFTSCWQLSPAKTSIRATRQAEESIIEAKAKLEVEQGNIDAMLGSMEGAEYVGPRAPKLPPVVRSMDAREFTLAALKSFGAKVTLQEDGLYLVEEDARHLRFHRG
jgi:hypothetical protein